MSNNASDFEIIMLFNQHKRTKLWLKNESFKPVLETPDECSANSVKRHFFLCQNEKWRSFVFQVFLPNEKWPPVRCFNETPFYMFDKENVHCYLSVTSPGSLRPFQGLVIVAVPWWAMSQIKTMLLSRFCVRKCHHNLLLISEETCHDTTVETVTLSTAQHIAICFIITISVMAWFDTNLVISGSESLHFTCSSNVNSKGYMKYCLGMEKWQHTAFKTDVLSWGVFSGQR